MNQDQTPLLDAIANFSNQKPAFFRIPAHRFQRGVDRRALEVLGERAYRSDLTEAEGLDDLHSPEGPIREAELLAAELFGSDRTWFLVNGTTCGNEAMLLACVKPGEKVLVPRNAHKSVLMGLIMSGAVPVWVLPEYLPEWHMYGAVSPERIAEALENDPEIRAVFLVSPTYYGVCSDLTQIAEICHAHGVPLLVDEAHGSHLSFSDRLPDDAIHSGADLVSQSIHKTGGSMTQSSMLQMKSQLVAAERVDACLKLVMSTSPNYLLMASLDGARHYLALHGAEALERAIAMADIAREEIAAIPGFCVMDPSDGDATRLVFSANALGISGYRLHERLYEIDQVSCELSDAHNVVAVISWGNTGDDIRRLVLACRQIAEESGAGNLQEQKHTLQRETRIPKKEELPTMRMTPREAFYAETERVDFEDAVGRAVAESIIPYPPGIPLIYPGEVLTKELYGMAQKYLLDGNSIHGVRDKKLATLEVIKSNL